MFTNFKPLLTLLLALSLIVITGCGTKYSFNNQTYKKPEQALQAHKDYLNKIESELKVSDSKPTGKVLIVTPSKKTAESLGITRTGQPGKEIIDYLGSYLENDYSHFSRFLTKSNLFETVEPVIDDFPKNYANKKKGDYDATIYLDMKSPTQISWFVMFSPEHEAKPIVIDSMAEQGSPKIQSWIDNINKLRNN